MDRKIWRSMPKKIFIIIINSPFLNFFLNHLNPALNCLSAFNEVQSQYKTSPGGNTHLNFKSVLKHLR